MSIANPHKKQRWDAADLTQPKKVVSHYGTTQAETIKRTRKVMLNDLSMLQDVNWRWILYLTHSSQWHARRRSQSTVFMWKTVCQWLPYISVPDHVPTCLLPLSFKVRCECWKFYPKILCLDTVYCKCHTCRGTKVAAALKETLQIDGHEVTQMRNFRLKFPVDLALKWSFTVSLCPLQLTPQPAHTRELKTCMLTSVSDDASLFS